MQNENNTEITIIENEIKTFLDFFSVQPAKIDFNFDNLNILIKNLTAQIGINFNVNNNIDKDKTNFVVDYENRKKSKQTYQSLNAISKNIDTVFKGKIKEAIAPVDKFKEDTKKSLILIESAVAFIQTQTKAHEEQLKLMCKDLLLLELNRLCLLNKLDTEYQDRIDINDLANLTNLNVEHEEAYITKKAKEGVEAKVNKMLLLQNTVKNRLSSLKDVCLTAGLITPLTKDDLAHILETDNEDFYNEAVTNLIKKELNKQENIKKQIELKQQQEAVKVVELPKVEPIITPTPPVEPQGTQTFLITATFEVNYSESADKLKILYENKFKEYFKQSYRNTDVKLINN